MGMFGGIMKSFVAKVAIAVVVGICTGGVGLAAMGPMLMQAAIQTAAETAIQRAAKLMTKKLGMPPEIAGAISGFASAVMSGGAGAAGSLGKLASSGSTATLTNAVGNTVKDMAGKALPRFADGLAAKAGDFAEDLAQKAINNTATKFADKVAKTATDFTERVVACACGDGAGEVE